MKTLLRGILFCLPFMVLGQSKGTIKFKETVNVRVETDDPEMQQRMANMPSSFDNYSILYFDGPKSIYVADAAERDKAALLEESRNAGAEGGGRGGMRMMFRRGGADNAYYADQENGIFVQKIDFLGRKFIVTDPPKTFEWQVHEDQKTILGYQCIKATFVDTSAVGGFQMAFGGPRGNRNNNAQATPKPEPRKITAWFAPQIQASVGPNEYGQLPGAILQLEIGRTVFVATSVEIDKVPENVIKTPEGGQKMNRKEFQKMSEEKMREMRESMGPPGGRGNEGGRTTIRIGN
ncbi:MAG: GLPGLI family protein [Bacteroidetes Order II. Incertae sedis bacterium]|nr:GLPGLI family protein [Bacteroidetes Order II. bacterium]